MPVKNADRESKALSKILFIEDDPLFRESTKELLEGEGFFVKEADSKNKAIEIGFEELFDLYLLLWYWYQVCSYQIRIRIV